MHLKVLRGNLYFQKIKLSKQKMSLINYKKQYAYSTIELVCTISIKWNN